MKNFYTALLLLVCAAQPISGQVTFTDDSNRLANPNVRSGAAMGIADMNNDGLDDIIRLDSARNLYIAYQASNGNFSNYFVGQLQGTQWGLCVADVDRNNYNDIFTGGANNGLKLIRADNTGSTYSITNLTAPSIFLQGANFADINLDGLADIFACHDLGLSVPMRNTGNGGFVVDYNLINPVSTIPSDNSGNYGSVWIDYNNDGKLDLYISKCRGGVSNPLDGRRLNLLFRNNGNGTFTEVAEAAGLRPFAQSWATDFADIDNDGDLDCFIIDHEGISRLYLNNSFGQFTDVTAQSGMLPALNTAGLGLQVKFEDFDNDGFVDMLYTSLGATHLLFHNNGDGTFTNVTNAFNLGGLRIHSATTGDLDNDGYIDIYASFGSGYNTPGAVPDKLLLNANAGSNYFKVRLRGTASNINGIGARLELYGIWGKQIREVRSGESYGIMSTFTRHFGLGASNGIDSLIVRWPSGVVDKIINPAVNQTLVVQEASNCVLSINFGHSVNGLNAAFNDQSTVGATQWLWNFGDGTTSTLQNPNHTYAAPGIYQVCLNVTGICGNGFYCTSVNVSCAPPVPDFSFFNSGPAGLTLNFTDETTNLPTQWQWNFGDGITSNEQNPQHTYPVAGTYLVCLSVLNGCGFGQYCSLVQAGCSPGQVGYQATITNLSVAFTGIASLPALQWQWDFGNGQTSSMQNPGHTYAVPGTYEVCLTVTNACGAVTVCDSITVNCVAPTAGYSAQINSLTVSLTDISIGNPNTWFWSFGDGATSGQTNPVHTYAAPGSYEVCLQVGNGCGSTEVCQTLVVGCAPPATGFSFQTNGLSVSLTDLSVGAPMQWNWSFGNGTTSTQQNPQVTYAAPGTYQICLQAASLCGTGQQVCLNVTVNCAPPASGFSFQSNGLTVLLTDLSAGGATQWNWTFSNGNSSNLQNPQVTFAAPGSYQICLQAASVCGTGTQFCQNVTVGCAPPASAFSFETNGLTVTLTDQSTGGPTTWNWTLDNGDTSTAQNPQVTYTAPGTYEICLQTASICGTGQQVCQNVTVSCASPAAAFSVQINGLSVTLTDLSTGAPTAWNWTLGNGNTSTVQNPQVTYTIPGTYEICLEASSLCGTGQQVCQNVTVSCAPPVAAFSLQANGLTVTLTDQSTGAPTAWNWDFDNGTTSTQQNPQLTYAAPGTYEICLEASSICGTGVQVCQSVTVSCAPPASAFSRQVNSLTVTLTDQSTGMPTAWSWDFGNGTTSTQQNPQVTYAAPGTYQICLVASSICGTGVQMCQSVTVSCAAPVAAFTLQANGLTITLTDQSTGAPTGWSWTVNGEEVSDLQNPQLNLPLPGPYVVCLTANSICGTGAQVCQDIIANCAPPVSAFSFQINGLTVTLTDQSTGSPMAWSWNFGNGTTSLQQNPQVTYAAPGTYQICFLAQSICGTGQQICQSVTVSCAPPVSAFSRQVSSLTVTLTDQSTGTPTAWSWNFGNGTTSTQQNPQVTYAAPGTYQICLAASSICGTGVQICQSVTVTCPAPQPLFSFSVNGLQVDFAESSGNAPTQWLWSFGDGNTSMQQNPEHTYAAPGEYIVCLQASSICGSNVFCDTVTINCVAPTAAFSVSTLGQLLLFSDASSNNPTQWLWNFGDGTISTDQNPLHLYPQNGAYQVCLIAGNACGADTICQNIIVGPVSVNEPAERLRFSVAPNPVKDNLTVTAENLPGREARLLLIDARGSILRQWPWPADAAATQTTVYMGDLPAGVYWVVLQTPEGRAARKVIKS
ncbi:MAG: PKD domain-containing protein [Saprospiraceae bacterium]|nr:PKD domain-containing protein [Saprospiraceae bacterium]